MIDTVTHGSHTRLAFKPNSKLDVSRVTELQVELLSIFSLSEGGSLELDLSNLEFIDPTGITMLLSSIKKGLTRQWTVSLSNPQPSVEELFKLMNLSHILAPRAS